MTTKKEALDGIDGITKAKKIGNNTYEYFKGDTRFIRLHMTDILTFYPDGSITFNTNGWETVTTKERMNAHQNQVNIHQSNFIWYYQTDQGLGKYFDGITIKDGKVIN